MGVVKRTKKPKTTPVINYPPVPTKKWVPPDKRPKSPKKPPAYVKPKGITQKLKLSSLKKVWHKFDVVEDCAILIGHYSQFYRKYTFKTNGYQGACNCVVACIFAHLYKMADFTRYTMDRILDIGDNLYLKSIQPTGDTCILEVPPKSVFNTVFMGTDKITITVDDEGKIVNRLSEIDENKVKDFFENALEQLFKKHPSGIFTIKGKNMSVWIQDKAFYFFDPTEHHENGDPWKGIPSWGYSLLWRCKTLRSLVDKIYRNVEANIQNMKFEVVGCIVERVVKINIQPPETINDLFQATIQTPYIPLEDREDMQPVDLMQQKCQKFVDEEITSADLRVQEISPEVGDTISDSKRTSWMADGTINKADVCKFPIPAQKLPPRISYYTELVPGKLGILRGTTCQTDIKLSKYQGRQSMGNAISALIMLRLYNSYEWVPRIVNTILKFGDMLYRDAMITIPRTQSLKLSNFQKKTEYEGRLFMPVIDEYFIIGKLQSEEFDVLDLGPALETFLADYPCCVVIGPLTLAIWSEEEKFYMFDPNERDKDGRAITKNPVFGNSLIQGEYNAGVACVLWFHQLQDLVDLYMNNVNKSKRTDTFYLCRVMVQDYIDIPEAYYNFKGIEPGKWILRGTMSQSDKKFKKNSRNLQSPATCFIALFYQNLYPVKDWSEETIDEILVVGDQHYNESIELLTEKGQLENRLLTLGEVKTVLNKDKQEVHFGVTECFINGILGTKENDINDLAKALEEFFMDNDLGIITCRQISLAVWKKDQFYYCFDSHDRDEKGKASGFGTACVLRVQVLEDLSKNIETNCIPSTENLFSINKVTLTIFECEEGGIIQPPLNNYVKLLPGMAILRSIYSEISNKFGITKGKQTMAMCLSAIAYNKLKPALTWSKADMDEILNKGDNLYIQTVTKLQETEEKELVKATTNQSTTAPLEENKETEDEENDNFQITSDNILTEFTFGFNKFVIEFSDIEQGNIRDNLKEALKKIYETPPEDEYNYMELIVESKPLTVAIWRDKGVFYLFDSKPRDKQGLAVNITQWVCPECVAKILERRQKEKEERMRQRHLARRNRRLKMFGRTEAEGYATDEEASDFDNNNGEEMAQFFEDSLEEESETDSEFDLDNYYPLVAESSSFWAEKEKTGKACIMWFTNLDELIDHVFNNIPAWEAKDEDFILKSAKINNSVLLKNKLRPEDERKDVYAGNWYFFQEIEHGKWILRGTMTMFNELFPKANRGKQSISTAYVALATAFIFSMLCYNDSTVDSILRYGDKLYSYVKRMRKNQLLQNNTKHLSEDDIDWLIENEEFLISDIPKKICMSKFTAENQITTEVVKGDVKAENSEDVLDVLRGLQTFFANYNYGILESRGLCVGIWKTSRVYYMFDGLTRGPSGIVAQCGSACILRYLKLEDMTKDFLQNLPEYGKNDFCIHGVEMVKGICPRIDKVQILTEPCVNIKEGGFKSVMAGKRVLTGTINQNDQKFGKEPNSLAPAVAIVALTMTLLHKTDTWSRPIIDDIIEAANELYDETVDYLGYDFNSWEEKMDIYKIKNDYRIGFVKANFEFQLTTQSGIIDIKNPHVLNLRQGIENFFEENTQGVIVTEPLTLAIWEEEQQLSKLEAEKNEVKPPLIYVFDPYPRSNSGMPLFTGTACLVSFNSPQLAAEHIISCILQPELRSGEFTIVPVEIVVAGKRTKCKLKEPSTKSIVSHPRCSKSTINEEIRLLRKIAENERNRKEAKRLQLIGRKAYYPMPDGEAIIRGYRSQNSEVYTEHSRNNQDIPNTIVAIVMHHISTVDNWNSKHIDLILDTAEQLYIDSYIVYGPKDKKLGLENIVRKFFMGEISVHVTVYQPIFTDLFIPGNISRALNVYFHQETFCMLNYIDQWVSIFFKSGFFYLFDPHERDIKGNVLKKGEKGTAVVNRFDNLDNLIVKLVQNLSVEEDPDKEENLEEPSIKSFSLWLILVDIRS